MEHSRMFENIKMFYYKHLWTKEMVHNAADKELITPEEYEEITGEPYVPGEEEATIQDYEDGMRELGVL